MPYWCAMNEYHRKTTLNLRVTDAEKLIITEKSKELGISNADFVLFSVSNSEVKHYKLDELKKFLLERHFGLPVNGN